METRLAIAEDVDQLAQLHIASFGDAGWSKQQISDSLALPTTLALVAQDNTALVGFILCQITADEADILTLCVDPDLRRQGVGQSLLQKTITIAQQKDVRRLFLEVAVDNQAALALYQNNGFRNIGCRANYYQKNGQSVDAIMLEKILD